MDFLQGALLHVGRGRVAAFGEAAMFSAQRKGPGQVPMGMNAPEAAQNARFTVAVLGWLASIGEKDAKMGFTHSVAPSSDRCAWLGAPARGRRSTPPARGRPKQPRVSPDRWP